MRVWIDLTNSPHVLVMRPVIRALERRGAEVLVTARDFAQTLGLLERFRIDHTAIETSLEPWPSATSIRRPRAQWASASERSTRPSPFAASRPPRWRPIRS